MTNGRYCMELIRKYVSQIPADTSLEKFCEGITRYINNIYEANNLNLERLKTHPEERLTASAIIYSAAIRQVWLVGDCQCLVNEKHYDNSKPNEVVLAEKRATFLLNMIRHGKTSVQEIMEGQDYGRKFILKDLVESCKWQNISYPVIDGFHIPLSHVKVVNVPVSTDFLVLASDGYPKLYPTLKESESALNIQLTNDPLCINTFKATKGLRSGFKSFDDRSYLKIKP